MLIRTPSISDQFSDSAMCSTGESSALKQPRSQTLLARTPPRTNLSLYEGSYSDKFIANYTTYLPCALTALSRYVRAQAKKEHILLKLVGCDSPPDTKSCDFFALTSPHTPTETQRFLTSRVFVHPDSESTRFNSWILPTWWDRSGYFTIVKIHRRDDIGAERRVPGLYVADFVCKARRCSTARRKNSEFYTRGSQIYFLVLAVTFFVPGQRYATVRLISVPKFHTPRQFSFAFFRA